MDLLVSEAQLLPLVEVANLPARQTSRSVGTDRGRPCQRWACGPSLTSRCRAYSLPPLRSTLKRNVMPQLDQNKIIVSDAESLLRLTKDHARGRVVLDLPVLTQQETREWETKINSYRDDCGCSMGAKFCLASTVLYYLHLFFLPRDFLLGIWPGVILGVPVALIAAGAGKGIGLLFARKKLQRTINELCDLLPAKEV